MNDKGIVFPFFLRLTIFLVGISVLIAILYIAKSILIPIVFATIIAMVLHPLVVFFVRHKINRIIAIIITLLIAFIIIAALATLLITQSIRFGESWPVLVEKITLIFNESIIRISGYLDIKPEVITAWISETKSDMLDSSGTFIGKTIISFGSSLVILFLIPVYVFLILFYEPLLIEFIHKLSNDENRVQVNKIVKQTKTVIQRYLIGLIIEAVIIAILYTLTLWGLGVDYAILLGIIGALLNIIPYIGGIVGVALPMMIAIATKPSPWTALYIMAIYYFIQLIDNNYIVPKIVASKVKINALFSIIIVIVGNAIWGVPGMFLSIPILAILKLLFDNIERLKPWGFLLGDTMPPILKIKPLLSKLKGKK